MSGGSSRRYPPELRERAVRMVAEISDEHSSEWAAISEVARLLGVGCAETVRKWVRQAQVDPVRVWERRPRNPLNSNG
jgi:transposase